MKTGILISQTYETVTPESAAEGDADDRGYAFENVEYSFRELVDLMKEHPECSSGGRNYQPTEHDWFSAYPWIEDYTTGGEKSTAIHYSRGNPPRMAKYWRKAAAIAFKSR